MSYGKYTFQSYTFRSWHYASGHWAGTGTYSSIGCVQVLAMPVYGLVVLDMATGAVATYHTPVAGLSVYDLPQYSCTRC